MCLPLVVPKKNTLPLFEKVTFLLSKVGFISSWVLGVLRTSVNHILVYFRLLSVSSVSSVMSPSLPVLTHILVSTTTTYMTVTRFVLSTGKEIRQLRTSVVITECPLRTRLKAEDDSCQIGRKSIRHGPSLDPLIQSVLRRTLVSSKTYRTIPL